MVNNMDSTILTAKQALEISRANDTSYYGKYVQEILDKILEAANNGKYCISIYDYEFGSGKCYTTEDKYPEQCRYIIEQLRSLGYNCIIKCEEKQFVSMWLEISWD